MRVSGKILKCGKNTAIRLPANVLVAAGINEGSEVDIHADKGCVMIQLHDRTLEQQLDMLLSSEPGVAEFLAFTKDKLSKVIAMTEDTTKSCYQLIDRLEQ
jgi:antitoxin component of MazEF toxin-antitoxin module